MLNLDSDDFICRYSIEIPLGVPRTLTPPGARECVSPELVERMGGTVAQLYLDFAAAFPLTSMAMQRHYGPPLLRLSTIRLRWVHCFLLEGAANNLVFGGDFPSSPKSGPNFDEYHAMLPLPWVELYRWFDSFGLTQGPIIGMDHVNTPVGYSARLDVPQLRILYVRNGIKVAKREAQQFERRMDSSRLKCWMYTEAGDTLWIDEQRLDRKVYHARAQSLGDVAELPDPSATLDRYLAYVVAGGKPADFDFRCG